MEREETVGPSTQGLDAIDAPTPLGGAEDSGMEDEGGEFDEELAAELDQALGDEDEDDDEDGEDGEDEDDDVSDEEDEDEDEDDEDAQARRLLNEEIRDLEVAVTKKRGEIASSANPIIRVRVYVYLHLIP